MKRLMMTCGIAFTLTKALAAPLPDHVLEGLVNDAMQNHTELNTKYWQGDKMDPKIRTKLNKIGQSYYDDMSEKLPNLKLQDILFSGSLANYNYTKSSDLDIHLVVDTSKVSCDKRVLLAYVILLNKYLHATADLSVDGTPLQVSIVTDMHETGGVYSLMTGKWVNKPTHVKPMYTKEELASQVKLYHQKIEAIQEAYSTAPQASDCEKAHALSKELKSARGEGLKRDGYGSIENNVYRILRNVGDLNALYVITKQCQIDKEG